jgi:hypothetical protein
MKDSPMRRWDIHEKSDFFEYVRLDDGSVPPADRSRIDIAVLDMNHSWPNLGHDALVHAVVDSAEPYRAALDAIGVKVRILSFDVRRRLQIPDAPNGRFKLYAGTGGPGHLDPRENDGKKPWAQGIAETDAWEAPLFRLYDAILASETAGLVALCHSFGLVCRWSGVATPELRAEKSSGMPVNTLTEPATSHPWFSRFAEKLPDHHSFRVVDNRLFDLTVTGSSAPAVLALDGPESEAATMVELARDADGMPRVFGVNHHPEIIDREHILAVLQEKRAHGQVTDEWYRERVHTMAELFQGEEERQSRLTSEFTLLGVLRHRIGRLVQERVDESAG